MKNQRGKNRIVSAIVSAALLAASAGLAAPAAAQPAPGPSSSAFSFQGQFKIGDRPFTGFLDVVSFKLFDAPQGGEPCEVLTFQGVEVRNGLFDVVLDFGADCIKRGFCWIEICVTGPDGTTQTLSPRQPILHAPKALVAECAVGEFNVGGPNGTVTFGPNGDCSIGIVPGLGGLAEMDPVGFRLLGQNFQGCRLLFGPTDDCTIEVNPQGPEGLTLRDPSCIRILNPVPNLPTKVVFGPQDDCSIGIIPGLPGLSEQDPTGFRLLGRNLQGCRLLFGPTNDCTIEINPFGPTGLTLRDPGCIRILNPFPTRPTKVVFGPQDDCSIGVIPGLPGLTETDPSGFRLLGQNGAGCRLIFGQGEDCTVEVVPGLAGLNLRDPIIRILPPQPEFPPFLSFGRDDRCFIAGPSIQNPLDPLKLCDPNGIQLATSFVNIGPEVFTRPPTAGVALNVQGALFAQEFVQISAARHKDNVQDIGNALDLVERLRGVSFDWKDMNNGRHDIGFIAEEVAQVLPELVTMDGDQAVGVAYHRLTAVTVEAIKAQQDEIDRLVAERNELEGRVARLEALLGQIVANGGN